LGLSARSQGLDVRGKCRGQGLGAGLVFWDRGKSLALGDGVTCSCSCMIVWLSGPVFCSRWESTWFGFEFGFAKVGVG